MYLLSKFSPTNLINFSLIKWEDFIPAMEKAKRLTQERVEKIKSQPASFENTILALENAQQEMGQIFSIFMGLLETNKDLDKVEEIDAINEKLRAIDNEVNNDLSFDMELFQKVKEVFETSANLNEIDRKLTKNHYQDFIDGGVNLPKEIQDRLREISDRTSALEIKIESNVQEEPIRWKVKVTKSEHLEGLSPGFIADAKELAQKEGFEGWLIAINDATASEVASFGKHRDLRIEVANLYRSRGNNNGEFDNKHLIKELLELRHEESKLLGFDNPAALTLKDRMIKNPQDAVNFLNNLATELRPLATKYFHIAQDLAKEDGIAELTQADISFYQTLSTGKMLGIDMSSLKHYFPYHQVWAGLQKICLELFGVRFTLVTGASTWHPDVEVYEVSREGKILGALYLDLFTRETKATGAWMNNLVANGPDQLPLIVVAANFSKSVEDGVILLNDMDEVRTLFHEIGHALHGLCSEVPYSSLAGTNVAWDFVELPSQIMENFCYIPEVINLYARHYKNGEKLPTDLLEKIAQSQKFFAAYTTLTYTGQACLDLKLHMENKPFNVEECEELLASFTMTKRLPKAARSTNFTHIWGGGYDSGYYSYLWANVLDADCFDSFRKSGFLNKDVGEKFRKEILAVGSSKDEMESFKAFKGREPEVKPLVELLT